MVPRLKLFIDDLHRRTATLLSKPESRDARLVKDISMEKERENQSCQVLVHFPSFEIHPEEIQSIQ